MYLPHRTRRLSHPVILQIFSLFACLILAVGWLQAAAPVLAQAANQSYDCGSYGGGYYGSNDCVVVSASPTPTTSISPTPKSTIGGLPVTGAQLDWIAVIGVGLISLGLALSLRYKRTSGGGPS